MYKLYYTSLLGMDELSIVCYDIAREIGTVKLCYLFVVYNYSDVVNKLYKVHLMMITAVHGIINA